MESFRDTAIGRVKDIESMIVIWCHHCADSIILGATPGLGV